ncbi:MAG: histidinol phosphatase [Chitinophagales bacterium]|jgi:protein-tyrosine phosphatase|nr:histidinol phosphatase [Chitinophagales bacterium]
MSLFSKLFGSKTNESSVKDFSWLKTDMHSHLIPGIDDGVKTLEESIAIIEQLAALGYKKIITSPHVMLDGYVNTPEIILKGRDDIRNELSKRNIDIAFDATAEYYLDEGIFQKIKNKELITFGDKHVLVELSYYTKPMNMTKLFFELRSAGYKVILAHPERYPFFYQSSLEDYKELRDSGILFQVNLGSLIGLYGKNAQSYAEKLIDNNMIEFAGTDIHNMRHTEIIKSVFQSPYMDKLAQSNLQNKSI